MWIFINTVKSGSNYWGFYDCVHECIKLFHTIQLQLLQIYN